MKIIIGKNAGFCFGVKRAVDGTLDTISNSKKLYCLGELVHNKEVIKNIESKGVITVDDLSLVEDNSDVIIRAHGISRETYELAKEKNLNIMDFTCPFVLKTHDIAEEYQKKGYYIFLIGSKDHPEIVGTSSYCGVNYNVIENDDDLIELLNRFSKSNINKLLVIVQTTYSLEKFDKMVDIIKRNISDDVTLEIKNTICNATQIRQDETNDISKKVECMIIIGGKHSSNTRKLYDIASNNCKHTFLIENETELNPDGIEKYDTVGIMAGASTPYESIEKVINLIKDRCS